jgi:type VI secretion system secreted protein Hcp
MQLLDIATIPGESQNTNPTWNQKIQISTLSYNISQQSSMQTGQGLVAGGASMSYMTITKPMDRSTPFLFFNLCSGDPIQQVTFRLTRAGGSAGPYEYLTIACQNVLVTDYSTSGARGEGNIPMETISFSVGAVTETYNMVDQNGNNAGKVQNGFSFQTNVPTSVV